MPVMKTSISLPFVKQLYCRTASFCTIERSRISTISSVATSSSTSFAFVPSVIIVKQYGHALPMTDGFTPSACSVRATLTRSCVFFHPHQAATCATAHAVFAVTFHFDHFNTWNLLKNFTRWIIYFVISAKVTGIMVSDSLIYFVLRLQFSFFDPGHTVILYGDKLLLQAQILDIHF